MLSIYCRILILFLCLSKTLTCQNLDNATDNDNELLVLFYNIENFFDIYNDPKTKDEEFTPEGHKRWNISKVRKKANNIYKTLAAAGKWNFPDIIGLAEIENKTVLDILIDQTPFNMAGYNYIHFESPDRRGIDVAMLYKSSKFKPIESKPVSIVFPFDTSIKTRDILYAKGVVFDTTMIHVFINHWPSRYGGVQNSEKRRLIVSSVLNQLTDSLFLIHKNTNVLIMGDFNDDPHNKSIQQLVEQKPEFNNEHMLWNMMSSKKLNFDGSLKYKANWHIFDQIIVSKSIYEGNNNIMIINKNGNIFAPGFLLVEDEKYMGYKPFRTYIGPKYIGGFSDHLPVMIRLKSQKDK